MIAFERGRKMAIEHCLEEPADLKPLLTHLGIEVVPWRFSGRVREVVLEGHIGIDDRLSEAWCRWLTAHAIGHHLLHTVPASTWSRGNGSTESKLSVRLKSSRQVSSPLPTRAGTPQ